MSDLNNLCNSLDSISGNVTKKKYEFTGETKEGPNRIELHRIRRLSDGRIGGWIEKEENLSHNGECWIENSAQVYGNARVYDNAQVYYDARVYDNAQVYGNAQVFDNAQVYGNARVYGDARVYGIATVSDNAEITGEVFTPWPKFDWDMFRRGGRYEALAIQKYAWERNILVWQIDPFLKSDIEHKYNRKYGTQKSFDEIITWYEKHVYFISGCTGESWESALKRAGL